MITEHATVTIAVNALTETSAAPSNSDHALDNAAVEDANVLSGLTRPPFDYGIACGWPAAGY